MTILSTSQMLTREIRWAKDMHSTHHRLIFSRTLNTLGSSAVRADINILVHCDLPVEEAGGVLNSGGADMVAIWPW